MLQRQYSWRYGHGGVSAQVAGETIEKIEARDGVVTKEAFLEESRPEESPTHACFEWDDTEAAEKWRLWQAGAVIRDICVTVASDDEEKTPIKTPVFVNTVARNVAPASFVSIDTALENKAYRDTVLDNALKELHWFERKYKRLTELEGIFSEISKIEKKRKKR